MQGFIKDKLDDLKKLCKDYNIKTMYVFGSVCTDNYFELHYKLEELFNRKIDLLTESSLSNPYFIESIEETKQLLYAV